MEGTQDITVNQYDVLCGKDKDSFKHGKAKTSVV
jgi:hypothetical protein